MKTTFKKLQGDIHRIKIKGITFKLTQFADDTTIFLDGNRVSLIAALNTLEIFGSLPGLKINTEKTKVICLGKKKHSNEKIQIKKS